MKHARLLKILAGFLSCMLVFTILSRAADQAGIVEVTTGFATKMSIDHSVNGTGKVVQKKETAVLTLPDQVVKRIYVNEGSQVEAGDLLFEVDTAVLEEQLVKKKQEIETQKLQLGDTKSRRDADEIKKSLSENQAAEDYDLAVRRGNLDVSIAAQNLQAAKEKLEEYRSNLGIEIIDDPVRDQLVQVCKEKETAYQKAAAELENLENQVRTEIEQAVYEANSPQTEPETPIPEPEIHIPEPETSLPEPEIPIPEPETSLPEPEIPIPEPKTSLPEPEIPISEPETPVSEPETPETAVLIPNTVPDTGVSFSEMEREIRQKYASKLQKAETKVSDAKAEKEAADTALANYDQQQLASSQSASHEQEQQLQDQVRACQQAYDAALLSSAEGLNSAGHSLENSRVPQGTDSTLEIGELDLELLELEAGKLEELLLKDGEVLSPVKGIVTEIAITTGNKTIDGMAVLLADMTAGIKFTAEIPKEQETYISRKDPVVLTPFNGEKIEGFTVDSVAASETEGYLTVTVDLPEDSMELGESAEFQIEKRSNVFVTCVPISAVHEDQNGSFVYVLQEKETILGTELTARRQTVTVQDKNSQYAALGDYEISDTQKIIVGSDQFLSDGSRIREEVS